MSKLVLVSGASGFLASHTVLQLLAAGYRVRGTVRSLKDESKVAFLREMSPDKLELVEADLTNAQSWEAAAAGCDLCCHIASPFPIVKPNNEMELITPAVEGTKNVLAACAKAGIKRVVLTSSVAAIYHGHEELGRPFNEEDWSVEAKCDPYSKSKLLAEKAAWEFQKSLPAEKRFELCTINPSFIQGPLLNGVLCSSQEPIAILLKRAHPGVAEVGWSTVDVRDVAAAHVRALEKEGVDGNRFILSARECWMKDIALSLSKEFDPLGYNVPTKTIPAFFLQILSLFDPVVKAIVPILGKLDRFDGSKATRVLGIEYRDAFQASIDAGHSLIKFGIVKPTAQYSKKFGTAASK
eukprot:c12442_g1_i1.p1 GENE.c12442_g1_i1~~c12442_g1_i1.p1  ORF type:complete len:353 (-),score=141.87 c12442_g1_i1:90-1148(-)